MAGDQKLVANTVRTGAVVAGAGGIAGGCNPEPLGIGGSRNAAGPLHCLLQGVADLVHARHHDHRIRPLDNGRHPVAVAVDVHHLPIQTQGIGSGEEHIRRQALLHQLLPLLG